MGSDFLKGLGTGLIAPTVIGYVSGWTGGLFGLGGYLFYVYIVGGLLCLYLGFKD